MAAVSSSYSSSPITSLSSSSSSSSSTIHCAHLCASVIFGAKSQNRCSIRWNSNLGLSLFSSWNGLRRHLGFSVPRQCAKLERKGRCKRNEGVYASLFGVGAPEALVIGVVALLVFGPKGLAEVARNLGKTLREFQPTIRELQDVSREFKSTLEKEIGLDEFKHPTQQQQQRQSQSQKPIYTSSDQDQNGVQAYSSEEYLKITEEQLSLAAKQQQQQQQEDNNSPTTLEPNLSDPQTQPQNDPISEANLPTQNP